LIILVFKLGGATCKMGSTLDQGCRGLLLRHRINAADYVFFQGFRFFYLRGLRYFL